MPDAEPVRREHTHVEFPDAAWTSFDRYARYGAIARAVRANLGPGRHQVLDVGDASGYLELAATKAAKFHRMRRQNEYQNTQAPASADGTQACTRSLVLQSLDTIILTLQLLNAER